MPKRRPRVRQSASRTASRRSPDSAPAQDRWLVVLAAAVIALYVARLFVPEDPGARHGHGATFAVLWLLLGALWLLRGLRHNRVALVWGLPEVLMVALVGWHSASAIVVVFHGSPRPALNMLWDWVAIGLSFLLARQIFRTPAACRAMIGVMVGMAVGLSAWALYQHGWDIPADQIAYAQQRHDTMSLYQMTGQWMPEGSNVRRQFENRLAAGQPTATFALTNTLAGYLAPWLVVWAGIWLGANWRGELRSEYRLLWLTGGSFLLLVPLAALFLTASRTAIAAAACGLLLVVGQMLGLSTRWQNSSWLRVSLAVVVTSVGLVLVFAWGVARGQLAGAQRSLAFRFEYWRSTWAMIRDKPWLGCGPGQFQDAYTAYKLPGASEEVQDPHQWLLEVWATAGTPAAILLLGLLVVICARAIALSHGDDESEVVSAGSSWRWGTAWVGTVGGIVLGVAVALLTGFRVSQPALWLIVLGVAATNAVMIGWASPRAEVRNLCVLGAITLLINLLAAGSIGYPALSDSLWLLLAMALNCTPRFSLERTVSRTGGISALIGLAMSVVLALWTTYLPVMECRLQLAIADAATVRGEIDERRQALSAAVEGDPWSAVAAQHFANQCFADYQQQAQASVLGTFTAANRQMLALAPRRSAAWIQSAEHYRAIFAATDDEAQLTRALSDAENAVRLYPAQAAHRVLLARLHLLAGDERAAREAAQVALDLDNRMQSAGHGDRLLEPSLRMEMEQLLSSN